MTEQKLLTDKQMELLEYIKSCGGTCVSMCPADVNQNKNFYQRVKQLERLGFVKVLRKDGEPSDFTLTDLGRSFIQPKTKTCDTENSDNEFIISLVKASDLSDSLKSKLLGLLN